MKKTLLFILLFILSFNSYAQKINAQDDNTEYSQPEIDFSDAERIRKRDPLLALVPGAVQMRRQWPGIAGTIWGCMAASGGLAIYEQLHIVKLQHGMENDPSSANWYDEQIRKSTKIRNGSLIALGGIYVANYISALLLPDKDPRTNWITAYADPQGAVGLTFAFKF